MKFIAAAHKGLTRIARKSDPECVLVLRYDPPAQHPSGVVSNGMVESSFVAGKTLFLAGDLRRPDLAGEDWEGK